MFMPLSTLLFALSTLAHAARGVSETADWTFSGEASDGLYGFSASACDLNGDGLPDAVVGAPSVEDGAGMVQVLYGTSSGPTEVGALTLSGDEPHEEFGSSAACAGDLNGDGVDDLVVGAPEADDDVGVVKVYLGSTDGPSSTPSLTLEGDSELFLFGEVVAGAGDINGDGFGDLLVLSWGGLFVIPGSAEGLDVRSDLLIELNDSYGVNGYTVAGAGDVNGDGFDDVILGIPHADDDAGRVRVYLGSPAGLDEPQAQTLVGEENDWLGSAVAGAGDVNGDGYADVLLGAMGHEGWTGRASLHLGSADGLSEAAAMIWLGELPYDTSGAAVAGAGDVDGDGYDDVLVGAPRAIAVGGLAPAEEVGRVSLYLGSADGVSAEAATTLLSSEEDDLFGYVVAGAGDVDGDGLDDVMVGAPSAGGGLGSLRLYRGQGPDPDSADPDSADPDSADPDSADPDSGAGDPATDTAKTEGCGCATGAGAPRAALGLLLLAALARRRGPSRAPGPR